MPLGWSSWEVRLPIRILLAEDHTLVRTLVRDRLNAIEGLEVVGETGNGLEAVELCRRLRPDVAILDLAMPGLEGQLAIPRIREVSPGTRCLVLTGNQSPESLREVLQVGGVGFLVKGTSQEILVLAIRRVAAGFSFIDLPVPSTEGLSSLVSDPPPRPEAPLTTHESELVRLVGLGHTNKEIAGQLHLAVKTIEAQRSRLMGKLGFTKRSELVHYGLENGLLRAPRAGS